MRICAWLSPHILFFHFHTFFRREISVVLSVFCCSGVILGLFRQSVCCVLFGVFFWVFVCCFLIPGLCRGLFGDFGLFCGIFLMLAKIMSVSVNLHKTRAFRV